MKLNFIIPTLFGVEGITALELKKLGLEDVRAETGRVLCTGTERDIPRLNLNIRTGERVLILIGEFYARTFSELFDNVAELALEEFIPQDGAFPVAGHSLNSQLASVPDCQAIIKKSAAKRLGAKYGMQTLPESGALYQIRFSIMKDRVNIMLDCSGNALHKRGYRAKGVVAPLRETLAATMVMVSKYRGLDKICDPFCGSGTIAIEAAMIAKNIAPGLGRNFASQKWELSPTKLWNDASDECLDSEYDGDYEIIASDLDPEAVSLAEQNAKLAGVDDLITFRTQSAMDFFEGDKYGRIVTNPPYGERIMERREAEELYRLFGKTYAQLDEGWKLYLLSSHTEFERTFGKQADKKRKLYNGMLKCDLFMYGKRL